MREMMAEGYRVKLASNSEMVLKISYTLGAVDLIILDPELPGMEASALLNALDERIPALPIVLHINRRVSEDKFNIEKSPLCMAIEKEGDSVERIKAVVRKLLSTSGAIPAEGCRSICGREQHPE